MVGKVLIIQTAFLGDLLLSIPLIKRLKTLYPKCEIDLICRAPLGSFFTYQGLVKRAIEIKKGDSSSYNKAQAALSLDYDLCLSPHESLRSALLVSKVNAKTKIGFRRWWNSLVFDVREPRDLNLPDALRQLSLLKTLDSKLSGEFAGFENSRANIERIPSHLDMKLGVRSVDFRSPVAESLFDSKFALLAPGSQWATKRWTREGFVEVARALKAQGLEVALIGSGADDTSINEEVERLVPGCFDLTNLTDLNELAFLMTKASVLVCNDSGLMHLASVAGLPTVAVFGPTTLGLGYRPWQNEAQVVEKTLACRPCGKHGHQRCPLNTHECMKSVSAKMVLDQVKQVGRALDQKELGSEPS